MNFKRAAVLLLCLGTSTLSTASAHAQRTPQGDRPSPAVQRMANNLGLKINGTLKVNANHSDPHVAVLQHHATTEGGAQHIIRETTVRGYTNGVRNGGHTPTGGVRTMSMLAKQPSEEGAHPRPHGEIVHKQFDQAAGMKLGAPRDTTYLANAKNEREVHFSFANGTLVHNYHTNQSKILMGKRQLEIPSMVAIKAGSLVREGKVDMGGFVGIGKATAGRSVYWFSSGMGIAHGGTDNHGLGRLIEVHEGVDGKDFPARVPDHVMAIAKGGGATTPTLARVVKTETGSVYWFGNSGEKLTGVIEHEKTGKASALTMKSPD